MDSSKTTYEIARQYAKAGIYVYPVYVKRLPSGKKKTRFIGEWGQRSSISLADIGAWEQEHPHAGLLIDCGKSGLLVVDCDGAEGVANWHALDPPEPLWIVDTAAGGEHWYYAADPDHPIGNDQDGKIAPKIDIRGLGGLVFAPPTSDGQGSWRHRGTPDLTRRDAGVPAVVIERMRPRLRESASTAVEAPFDVAQKQFTTEQAKAFIEREFAKLKATKRGFNGAINAFAMTCAHFPWLVDRAHCGRLVIKALGASQGWTAPDHDDERTIDSAYSATEAGRSWVAERVEAHSSVGDNSGTVSSELLPPPGQPLAVARELLERIEHTDGQPHWSWWRGDFYRWTGAHWEIQDAPEVERWLYSQTGDAHFLMPAKKEGEPSIQVPWAPTRKKVGDLAHALGVGVLQRTGEEDRGVLAAANGVVVRRELQPHRPSRFNLFSLPFDYQPAAGCPAWLTFLDQVLPDDRESQDFLGEWFGYVLSGRTDQQKMAALIGKRRSGKGTVGRVLAALVGPENVSGVNLGTLGATFGLEPFIGAALAMASDVRWTSRGIGDAVQILLEVSGEDHVTVHRKNRAAWKGRLGARFMLMSNDTPTFSDRSGALVDRMIYVSFRQSFFGREDISLTDKLMHELPGILNWALDGLDRLDGRGRFTQPAAGELEREAARRLADPIGAFLDDWCEVGEGRQIELDHLYLKYQLWCDGEGRTRDSTTKEIFSRELRGRIEGLRVERTRIQGKRVRTLFGITSDVL